MTTAIVVAGSDPTGSDPKGGGPMKGMKIKRILLAALVAMLMAGSANVLTGCLVCRDCGPHRVR